MSKVAEWNLRCGNIAPSWDSKLRKKVLLQQVARIQEELDEAKAAIKSGDNLELLDGLVDIQVTYEGLAFLAGLNTEEAFRRVMENNDLKYTTDYSEICESLEHHGIDLFNIQEYIEPSTGVSYYSIHRNKDNKICKLMNHPRVDLTDLVKEVNHAV